MEESHLHYISYKMNLQNFGYQVLVINEAATELKNKGRVTGNENSNEFANMIVEYQLKRELEAEKHAKTNVGRFIILSDRSAIEPAAYIGIDKISEILDKYEKNFKQVRDSYDMVIHITSVAKDASEFYTLENNSTRSESISEAIAIDDNLMEVWAEHPNRYIVDNNCNGFDEKLKKIVTVVVNYIHKKSCPEKLNEER